MFKIIVDPIPCPRPRITIKNFGKKQVGQAYYPKPYKEYKDFLVKEITKLNIPKNDYSVLHAVFASPYPKSTPKKRLIDKELLRQKYDLDNVVKPLMDALEISGVLENDRQICAQYVEKIRTTGAGYIEFYLGIHEKLQN